MTEEKYIFKGKEYKNNLEFLRVIYEGKYEDIKHETIEIKTTIEKFIESSGNNHKEILTDVILDKHDLIIDKIIEAITENKFDKQ